MEAYSLESYKTEIQKTDDNSALLFIKNRLILASTEITAQKSQELGIEKDELNLCTTLGKDLITSIGAQEIERYVKRLKNNPLLEHPIIHSKMLTIRAGSNLDTMIAFLAFMQWIYDNGGVLKANKIEFPSDFKQTLFRALISAVSSVFLSDGTSAITSILVSLGIYCPVAKGKVNYKFLAAQLGSISEIQFIIKFLSSIPNYLKSIKERTSFDGSELTLYEYK